jgi:hypothetical protein
MSSEKLQNELVEFVDSHISHPEIIRSQIIKAFDTMKAMNSSSTPDYDKHGVGNVGVMIIKHIVDNMKDKIINTSDDIHQALAQFGLCVDFINLFVERLCNTERNHHNHGTYSNSLTPYMMCVRMGELVHPLQPGLSTTGHGLPNINELVKRQINQYQAKILKLWSNVLIRQGKIKSDTIDEMKTIVGKQDGYERKMRELYEKCKQGGSFKSHLDESILLEWLALFNVASIAQITNTYANIGSLDYIVFGILSQFVPLNNVYGYSGVPQSKNNMSKFNVLHLTCYVVKPSTVSIGPIIAYLSSDELDQCVRDIGQFPTAEQFLTSMPTAQERFQALKARVREQQMRQADQNSLITIEQPILTAQERFQALKARVREQQIRQVEQPILTAHERFLALKARLRERQMTNSSKLKSEHAGGKKIKSKSNKSCRKYRKKSRR